MLNIFLIILSIAFLYSRAKINKNKKSIKIVSVRLLSALFNDLKLGSVERYPIVSNTKKDIDDAIKLLYPNNLNLATMRLNNNNYI